MGKVQERIIQLAQGLPEELQNEVLDYLEFLYMKANEKSDTEYIAGVPGMVEKIHQAAKTPLEECDTELDW
jgi:hypothetical protein